MLTPVNAEVESTEEANGKNGCGQEGMDEETVGVPPNKSWIQTQLSPGVQGVAILIKVYLYAEGGRGWCFEYFFNSRVCT